MDDHLLRFDANKKLVFFDAETFNLCLNAQNNVPWQIAMIKVNGVTQEKDILIKWDTDLKCGQKAAEMTRYDYDLVQRIGISPEEAFKQIEPWLEEADYIVGHNIINFDYYMMRILYHKVGKSPKHLINKFLDTNALARAYKYGQAKDASQSLLEFQYKLLHTPKKGVRTSLIALGKEFGIEHDYDNLHDALIDLQLNIKVWNKLKFLVEL